MTLTVEIRRNFRDKTVFQESYVPERMLHRNEQAQKISSVLSDLHKGVRPRNILGSGGYGTGKTALVCSLCRRLSEQLDIPVLYVNCSENDTRVRVLRSSLEQLGFSAKHGFPSDYYFRWFKETVSQHMWVILILDEVNRLVERKDTECNDLFYMLSRSVNNVIVIMLTNKANLQSVLSTTIDASTRDTFRWELVEFGDYYANELSDILKDRCQAGFEQGVCDDSIIANIAKKSYDQGLSVRGILNLAVRAGEVAELKHHDRIMEEDVREADSQLRVTQDSELVRRLSPPRRALLTFILEKSPIPREAYDWFQRYAVEHHIGDSHTQFQLHVKELEGLGLVVREIHGNGRARGTEVRLIVNSSIASIVRQALESTL